MGNDMRKLNPSALENACQILNQDFIDSLPYSQKNFLNLQEERQTLRFLIILVIT